MPVEFRLFCKLNPIIFGKEFHNLARKSYNKLELALEFLKNIFPITISSGIIIKAYNKNLHNSQKIQATWIIY